MERPPIKDKAILAYVEYLEAELKIYKESPLVSSYLSTLTFIETTDQSIIDKADTMLSVENKPIFEMAHKYNIEKIPYFEQLKWLRKEMSPEQVKELDTKLTEHRIAKKTRMNIAEKIALNGTEK